MILIKQIVTNPLNEKVKSKIVDKEKIPPERKRKSIIPIIAAIIRNGKRIHFTIHMLITIYQCIS